MAPRHAAAADRRRRVRLTVAGCVVLVVAAAAVTFALLPTTINAPSAGAAVHGPLQVRTITPTGTVVSPDAPLRVVFNNPLAATSPMPTIAPAVAGSWARLSANEVSFRASAPMTPGTSYVLTVPSTTSDADGTTLHTAVTRRFIIAMGSTLRLNQVLAELGYLPVRFVPTGPFHPTSTAVQRGTFTWRWADVPPGLSSQWQPSSFTVITRGALMAFEERPQLHHRRRGVTAHLGRPPAGRRRAPARQGHLQLRRREPGPARDAHALRRTCGRSTTPS